MSTVIPMRTYTYEHFCRIVLANNILRADKGHRPWPEDDCKQLWIDVFSARG